MNIRCLISDVLYGVHLHNIVKHDATIYTYNIKMCIVILAVVTIRSAARFTVYIYII